MKLNSFFYSILVFIFLFFLSCSAITNEKKTKKNQKNSELELSSLSIDQDTTILIAYENHNYEISVMIPDTKVIGTMLILQGWNFPNSEWCDSTELCSRALRKGYVLVCPDMGKSIYALKTYKETRQDWRKYPTRSWLTDSVLPFLNTNFNLFDTNQRNCVVGLSTGGRGALFIALDNPKIFSSAACLSGDFDQSEFPNDNLYKGYFGKMNLHPDRWREEENPLYHIAELKIPLYLGHGLKDKVVPPKHTELLVSALKGTDVEMNCVVNYDKGAEHNYSYWNSEVENILDFFDQNAP